VFKPTAAEKKALTLKRVAGLVVPFGKVLGLERRGWSRSSGGGGIASTMEKTLPDGRQLQLALAPGLDLGRVADSGDQTLGGCGIGDTEKGERLDSLDPIAFSELVADLETLRA